MNRIEGSKGDLTPDSGNTAKGGARSLRVIRLFGVVQGVGFRPFVHRTAERFGVKGTVCNKGAYVEIEAEGSAPVLDTFLKALLEEAPARSAILKSSVREGEVRGFAEFRIIKSRGKAGDVFVSPDIATCPACLKEMYDPADRRYRHPFINCTACGPRLTILEGMPYDRARTSMRAFPMCPECGREYTDPQSRRFHAQPVACPSCGPTLKILWARDPDLLKASPDDPAEASLEALKRTREVIRSGGIAAIKGIGGFHLSCDALDPEAVRRLRLLKERPTKPFAVMAPDLETARRYVETDPSQEAFMSGPQKPILLLRKRGGEELEAVSPANPYLGVMLPYAPVHYLLFDDPGDPAFGHLTDLLVMTSANRSGCPICRSDSDAKDVLTEMCDVILTHDREIRIRADDSVMGWQDGRPLMIRRSRGYAPLPVIVGREASGPVLAMGGELKNTFALMSRDLIYPAAYLSDMADPRSLAALEDSVGRMEDLLAVKPRVIAVDGHPAYRVSALGHEIASRSGLPVVRIQHHFAHVVSCMAEHDIDEPVIGAALDGTGWGDDGTIWGCEFFANDRASYERHATLERIFLPGGDRAAVEGWRPAVSWLWRAFGDEAESLAALLCLCSETECRTQLIMTEKEMNGCRTSSAGRLFDAASALLGICRKSTFEGEAATALQYAAERALDRRGEGALEDLAGEAALSAPTGLIDVIVREDGLTELSPVPLIRRLVEDFRAGGPADELALLFHRGIAELIAAGCRTVRQKTGIKKAALTGGTMQNTVLVAMARALLKADGFEVYTHEMIPANDNGLAVGQALAAAASLERGSL